MGGGDTPQPASPMAEAQAQMALEAERNRITQQQAAADKVTADAEKQANISKAQPLQAQAYQSASGYGRDQVQQRGLDQGLIDKYGVLGAFSNAIDTQKRGIAEDNLNPDASYTTRSSFDDALDTGQGTYRGDLKKDIKGAGYDDGFEYNQIADTMDDPILQAILSSQQGDAQKLVDNAKARGTLNDVGYARAESKLGEQGKAGMSTLQSLGQGVLGGYRTQLVGARDQAMSNADNASFSDPFNVGNALQRLTQLRGSLTGGMENDLYKATSGQSFYDPSAALALGGSIQGTVNPTIGGDGTSTATTGSSNPLLAAFQSDAAKKKATTLTGAGGTGTF